MHFDAGAQRDIYLVYEIDEALTLRRKLPDSLVMGEEGGRPIEGFDYDNSPAQFVDADLSGIGMIQRTSNGVQGVVRSDTSRLHSRRPASCAQGRRRSCCAHALLQRVTFVVTGWEDGEEDSGLRRLSGGAAARRSSRTLRPTWTECGIRGTGALRDPAIDFLPAGDLPLATDLDRFDFALEVRRHKGLLRMLPVARRIGAGLATDCGIYRGAPSKPPAQRALDQLPKDHCDQTESHLFTERIPLMPRIRRRHV